MMEYYYYYYYYYHHFVSFHRPTHWSVAEFRDTAFGSMLSLSLSLYGIISFFPFPTSRLSFPLGVPLQVYKTDWLFFFGLWQLVIAASVGHLRLHDGATCYPSNHTVHSVPHNQSFHELEPNRHKYICRKVLVDAFLVYN